MLPPPTKSEVSRPALAASLAVRSRMSREPGPKTTTLGASMADNITLRSATIRCLGREARRERPKFPRGVNNRTHR
eukprot:scaffold62814_cov35-Phaeocystis_antarctica.AAC.3